VSSGFEAPAQFASIARVVLEVDDGRRNRGPVGREHRQGLAQPQLPRDAPSTTELQLRPIVAINRILLYHPANGCSIAHVAVQKIVNILDSDGPQLRLDG